MSDDKIYCGSGKKFKEWSRSISICLEDIPKEHISKAKNGKTYINLNVVDKKEKDQYGKDVYVTVNTWKKEDSQPEPHKQDSVYDEDQNSELPF